MAAKVIQKATTAGCTLLMAGGFVIGYNQLGSADSTPFNSQQGARVQSEQSVTAPRQAVVDSAAASVPGTYCNKRSYKTVVKKYSRGAARLPLRCGTSTWGFKHITHRWNAAFDSKIALTIARGEKVKDLQQDGGTAIYALFNNKCVELFRVIYNGGAYRGNGVRPQGIITAYHRALGTASAGSPAGATAPGSTDANAVPKYRTNCRVDQDI